MDTLVLYFLVLAVGYNHRFVLSTLSISGAHCSVVLLWKQRHPCFRAAALYIAGCVAWILIDTLVSYFLVVVVGCNHRFVPST